MADETTLGINTKATNQVNLQSKLMNMLTVSGGYISTERDDMGTILLYEDSNNLGSNKQLVTQWISVDIVRRDYDDEQLKKVFDIDINELYKLPKTKTTEELRAEIERLRRLLADAESDIIIQQVVDDDGTGGGDGDGDGTDDSKPDTIISSGETIAPFVFNAGGKTYKIETGIWNTSNQRIEQSNVPTVSVIYKVYDDNILNKTFAEFTSKISNPEYWQGWYYDAENLGNTQNYISLTTTDGKIKLEIEDDREKNQGDPNVYTLCTAFKDESPPIVTTDRIRFQMESYDFEHEKFTGQRDNIRGEFRWTLRDASGAIVDRSSDIVANPFEINVLPNQELTVTMIRAEQTVGVNRLKGWYLVTENNDKTLLPDATGVSGNVIKFVIPQDIKGLILAYVPDKASSTKPGGDTP